MKNENNKSKEVKKSANLLKLIDKYYDGYEDELRRNGQQLTMSPITNYKNGFLSGYYEAKRTITPSNSVEKLAEEKEIWQFYDNDFKNWNDYIPGDGQTFEMFQKFYHTTRIKPVNPIAKIATFNLHGSNKSTSERLAFIDGAVFGEEYAVRKTTDAVIKLIEARIVEYLQLIQSDSTGWLKYVRYKSTSDELTDLLTQIKKLK